MPPLPTIGLTMGDPVGVGPEIIVKALAQNDFSGMCRIVVFGDHRLIEREMQQLGADFPLQICESFEQRTSAETPCLVCTPALLPADVQYGHPTQETGKAMATCILEAVKHARSGAIDAVVTAPINKQALNQAGYDYPGHTEMLAHLTGTRDVVMMLAGRRLRVVLVTIHCALADVPPKLTAENILRTATITAESLERYFTGGPPRIAVAALNPHAGEGGLFGREEQTIIAPAIEQLRQQGLRVSGPHPPDTVFHAAARGDYDAVVCMYHDQGLIPLKLLHFEDGVNVTLGLPIIRTSVDHGTAYDIAGKGIANPASLVSAISMAADMAKKKNYE